MPNLLLRPSGFYFRLRLPRFVREAVQKRFLVFALPTRDKDHAQALAALAYFRLRSHFKLLAHDMARQPGEPPLQELLDSIKKTTVREALSLGLPDGATVYGDTKAEFDHAARTYKENFQGKVSAQAPSAPALAPCPTISAMREKFVHRAKARVRPETANSYEGILKLFEDYFSNRPMNQISVQNVGDFVNDLLKFPVNAHKKKEFEGLGMIAAINANEKALKKSPTLAAGTVQNHIDLLSQFFSYCIRNTNNLWPRGNPLDDNDILPSALKNKVKRLAFDDADLRKIFDPKTFAFGLPSARWIPLLAFYTGARLNELAQLHVDDVINGKIPYIDINANTPDKKLKNATSVRIVPIHPHLIALGFLKFAKEQQSKHQKRLFPELPLHKKNGYGFMVTKRFHHYLREVVGIKEKTKVFHSFRHTFLNTLKQEEVELEHRSELAGQRCKGVGAEVYVSKFRLPLKLKALLKLKVPFDWKKNIA